MTDSLRIRIAEDAKNQITEAMAWWAENRPMAPNAIEEELDRALRLLTVQPEIGVEARRVSLRGVRRVRLSRVGYYVYYRVTGRDLQVLAFWHVNRGRGPTV